MALKAQERLGRVMGTKKEKERKKGPLVGGRIDLEGIRGVR